MYQLEFNGNVMIFPTLAEANDYNANELDNQGIISPYTPPTPIYISPLTKQDIHKLAEEYQDNYYDVRGLQYLQNVKGKLERNIPVLSLSTNLPYQMIRAVERFVNKIWGYCFTIENLYLVQQNPIVIDYPNNVGLPPCQFRDIMWVLDDNSTGIRLLEPYRTVNTTLSTYLNYNP